MNATLRTTVVGPGAVGGLLAHGLAELAQGLDVPVPFIEAVLGLIALRAG